ncbi:hypothetical protein DFH06DRAFT_1301184 [Mycena polygramma]|nr:hypothetical protein DFH06DRAFT_1301184 [Mycena polygramma]
MPSQLNSTIAFTAGDPSYILMIACPGSGGDYTLILVGSGRYNFMQTTVCTLSPKITTVKVDYSDAELISGIINTTTLPTGAVTDSGPAGLAAVNGIYIMQFYSQATSSNTMGDELISLLEEVGFEDDTILSATANYIRGVAEYSGSVFRACLSGRNGTFVDGVPRNMSASSRGLFHTEAVGWGHVSLATFLELIPGTIVAFATILIVLLAVAHHAGDPDGEYFDPSDPMHLVLVSAAGGLDGVFRGTGEHDIETAESVRIVLGTIPARGLALKVRGAYDNAT